MARKKKLKLGQRDTHARSTRLKLCSSSHHSSIASASENLDKTLLGLIQSLPTEIRERIYSYYFVDVYYVVELIPGFHPLAPLPDIRVLQSENQATPRRVLQSENQAPLLRTCRFLRKDAWPSYVRHILFVIASPIPPLRRIKYPEWKDYTEDLYRSMKAQAKLVEDQAAELLDHDVRKEDEVSPKKISAFDWERQESYYQNWHLPVLLLSEIIPKDFLRHIRSITGVHLEDLSDQHLLHDPDIYLWLRHDELPCLRYIGFEQRKIEWEQDIGSDDYDYVVTKLLTPESTAYKADALCWDRARVHWNIHPTIHFVTKFYAQHFLGNRRKEFLTPVSINHRAKSVTWAQDVTVEFPQWENSGYWADNLWLHSHRAKVM